MKTNLILEYSETKITYADCVEKVKDIWREKDKKIKDIKTLDIYLKPEENMVYYVINGDITGSFPM